MKKRMAWDAAPRDASSTGRRASTLLVRRVEIRTLLLISHIGWVEGKYFPFKNPADILEELRVASRGGVADYYGITYERVDKEKGICWPCPDLWTIRVPQCFSPTRSSTPTMGRPTSTRQNGVQAAILSMTTILYI